MARQNYSKMRLLSFCNARALEQVRVAQRPLQCQLCATKIQPGDEYRGERDGSRAHNECIAEVLATYRSRPRKGGE